MRLSHIPTSSATPRWLPDELERKAKAERGQTVLANVRRDSRLISWAKENGLYVYIGRNNGSDPGPWGNPFILKRDGDRDAVCERFARHLEHTPELLARVPSLRGMVLGCYCFPLRCHGLSYLEALNKEAR